MPDVAGQLSVGDAVTVMVHVPVVAVPFTASLTLSVNVNVPANVGVPLTVPFAATDKPDGSVPVATVTVAGAVPPVTTAFDV